MLDIDKINSGDQVVIAMTKENIKTLEKLFTPGSELPLSDVICGEKFEESDLSMIIPDVDDAVYIK